MRFLILFVALSCSAECTITYPVHCWPSHPDKPKVNTHYWYNSPTGLQLVDVVNVEHGAGVTLVTISPVPRGQIQYHVLWVKSKFWHVSNKSEEMPK